MKLDVESSQIHTKQEFSPFCSLPKNAFCSPFLSTESNENTQIEWEWSLRVTKLDFESSKTQKATFSSILWLTQELLLHAISFNRVQHKLCCRICANHPESGWLAEKFAQNRPVENWIVRNVLRHKREDHLLEGLLEEKNGTMQNNLKKQIAYACWHTNENSLAAFFHSILQMQIRALKGIIP